MKTSAHIGGKLTYTVVFEPAEEGGYIVHVPALPGCFTQGETFEEANKNAKDAIECYLLAAKDMGEDIPTQSDGTVLVMMSTNILLDGQ